MLFAQSADVALRLAQGWRLGLVQRATAKPVREAAWDAHALMAAQAQMAQGQVQKAGAQGRMAQEQVVVLQEAQMAADSAQAHQTKMPAVATSSAFFYEDLWGHHYRTHYGHATDVVPAL